VCRLLFFSFCILQTAQFPQAIPWCIIDVPGDGNCMFTAVARGMWKDGEHRGQEVRKKAVAYVLTHFDDFSHVLERVHKTSTRRQYKLYMSENGVWGDEVELCALSKAYSITIKVFTGEF
jgi:hypothetical protein